MGVTRGALVLALAACSSNKPRTADDALHAPPPRSDAPATDASAAADAAAAPPASTAKTGDLHVRVAWRDVPIAMRASPGRTACNTPRAPAVAPTTTWGIPDVVVVVDGAPAATAPAARIVLADCALAPRLVAATSAVVESAVDRPAKLAFAKRGEVAALDKLDKQQPRAIQLPIAGHTVALPLEPNGVYELTAGTEAAWIVASPNAAVTDASGGVLVKDLAPGTYAVTAWLPPRAGAAAKLARGKATVVAGDLAQLELALD